MIQETSDNLQPFITDIRNIIKEARETAARSIDHSRVVMYWTIGKRIFEKEQQG